MGDGYLQFPLSALAYGGDVNHRLNRIIDYGCVTAGSAMYKKLDPEIRNERAGEFTDSKSTPSDYNRSKDHVAIMIGANEIGITLPSLKGCLAGYFEIEQHTRAFAAKYGDDATVRVRKDLVFSTRDCELDYREFAVFCAVVSVIGAKANPVRIIRETVQARSLGYKTRKIMESELANRTDNVTPLTIRQVGYTIDELHKRKFFARARANKRQTYYGIRLSQQELEDALFAMKTGKTAFHLGRQEGDRTLMDRIAAHRKLAASADAQN